MKIGIVGLPNAGKSTLFNALTQGGAETAGYAFTTIDPNVAVVPVPDERLDRVAETLGSDPVVHETISFHDIAGLVEGAHRGEGLGNQFLGAIRETDVLLHLVRAHDLPDAAADPTAHAGVIDTELVLADLEQAERRRERVAREAKSGEKRTVAESKWLGELVEALEAGRAARTVPPPGSAPDAQRLLSSLTAKPVLYVANVEEGAALEPPPEIVEHAREEGAGALAVSARLEAELAELDSEEADAMRADLGVPESGLDRVIRATFDLLGLITFFTADRDVEARAHAIPRGETAAEAAGEIHTDMQRGFVRAEIVPWDELVDAGGYAGARERGTLRSEGRDYVITDGDVVHVKFTP